AATRDAVGEGAQAVVAPGAAQGAVAQLDGAAFGVENGRSGTVLAALVAEEGAAGYVGDPLVVERAATAGIGLVIADVAGEAAVADPQPAAVLVVDGAALTVAHGTVGAVVAEARGADVEPVEVGDGTTGAYLAEHFVVLQRHLIEQKVAAVADGAA